MAQEGSIIRRLWRRVRMNPTLGWGCEISPAGVCLARWDGSASGLAAIAWRPLTEGAVEVSPLRENLLRTDEVRRALSGCLDSLGRSNGLQASGRSVDVALVIPDQAARVFFLTFDSFPSQPSQAIPLVRWKLKKSVPFDIETSTLSYLATRGGSEWQVLAVVSPDTIVRQYEQLAEDLGLKPRFVTLSTLGSLGLVPASPPGAPEGRFLLAKYSPPWLTTTIVHQDSVRLFRTVSISAAARPGDASAAVLREVLEAIYPSVAYFQDNFGMPLEAAFLCGLGEATEAVSESLARELKLPARALLWDAVDVPTGLGDPLEAERHLAALSGISRVRRRG
jgi:type IV pilus assembly protein PilM